VIVVLPVRKEREIVLQLLFSCDVGGEEPEVAAETLASELKVSLSSVRQACQRAEKILAVSNDLDEQIRAVSQLYEFDRIQRVERSVLRLAIYELLYDESIPPKVAIAEGLRLCRKFSTPEAARFVNALLDRLYAIQRGEEEPLDRLAESVRDLEESERRIQETQGQ
jgi:transcription antitermination protein NusB